MSDQPSINRFEELAKQEQKKEELKVLQDAVRKYEAKNKLKRISDNQKIQKTLATAELDTNWDDVADKARKKAEQRQSCIPFIYEDLREFVQLSAGSLALFCASTGTGKSCLAANIAKELIKQGKRVLVIVNEEENDDVGIRISCLDMGVSIHRYKIKDGLSDIEREKIITNMVTLAENNVTICGLDFKSDSRIVTSPEGMKALLTRATGKFDAIIIDYYQNVNYSVGQPGLRAHEANEMFANDLDVFKNSVGCPIILMAQIRRGESDYKERLEGRRLILNKATDIFELKTEKRYSRSLLIVHKDRWLGNQGQEMFLGYEGGAYIPYTAEFEQKVIEQNARLIEKQTEVKDNDFQLNTLVDSTIGKEHSDMLDAAKKRMEGKQ